MREWQFIGNDEWVFGLKVWGIVRHSEAEVYFDDESDDRRGGWVWMTNNMLTGEAIRGRAVSLVAAVIAAEEALGLKAT